MNFDLLERVLSMNERIILLKRVQPTVYELHLGVIRQRDNLILSFTDEAKAVHYADNYNKHVNNGEN